MSTEATWREALEVAAEFLMDHGVITTGPDLERVCEQIKNLKQPPPWGSKRVIKAEITGLDLMLMSTSKSIDNHVLDFLRSKGIPAVSVNKLEGSFLVARGRIEYRHDLARDVHSFRWEELLDEVPF